MGAAIFFIVLWFIHAGIGLLPSAPIVYLGRHRVTWHWWDLLAAVTPFADWSILMLIGDAGKSMSNFALEPMCFALPLPLAAIARVLIGKAIDERVTSTCITTALTAIAAAVYWFVPGLPE